MKTIGAFDAKTRLSELLRDIEERHEHYTIQRHGVDIAVLLPVDEYRRSACAGEAAHIVAELRAIRNTVTGNGSVKDLINDGRKY